MRDYEAVRCPGDRPHVINGIEYCDCGSMLCGINRDVDQDLVRRCKVCKRTWIITNSAEDGLVLKEVPPHEYINYTKK